MGVEIAQGEGNFGGEFGASHCNQWDFVAYCCVKLHEAIKIPFEIVSGVS